MTKQTTLLGRIKENFVRLYTLIIGKQVTIIENGVSKTYSNGEMVSYVDNGTTFARIIRGDNREDDVFLPG